MSEWSGVVGGLARERGVRAAVIASEREGLLVEGVAHVDVRTDALAAFGAAVYRRVRQAGASLGLGETGLVTVDAQEGRLWAVGKGELVLVVIAGREAAAGRLRMAMQRAVEGIA
jgi:predicted regulator of Ras-like GTPase activity (Roadblock/LC7/MglB family)